MIKILFMIHDLSVGGAEKVLVNLLNNMDREKFDITLIALFGGGVNEQFLKKDINYRIIFNRTFPGNSKIMKLMSPKQLHRLFIKGKYDIEVAFLEGPVARIIGGCPYKDTKLVSWIHVEQHTKMTAASSFRSYRESVELYKKFDNIICVSEFVKNDFKAIYPMINKLEVLYNTNEVKQILDQEKQNVEAGLFRNDEFNLIGVGKIVPIKGFDKLARIHKRLREEGYSVHSYILGSGSDQEKIQKYLEKYHMADTFTFLGYQTNPYKYISKSDLFVCASKAEGFSTAATEALIVGTPICTVDVSGMKEMLGNNNEYGIVTDNTEEALYEGIKALIDHPERLRHYRLKAKERGRFFSTENTVKAVEDMLLNL